MDLKMERVKLMVGGQSYYCNKLDQQKLLDLDITEENQEKQRKKNMTWMKEKETYCLTQEQKEVQQIEEQRLVVEAERQKIAVSHNAHALQYQLELVLNEGTRLPLLWMDLPNKTK